MEVFSGRSSPTWTVDTRSPVYDRLSRLLGRARPTRMLETLGYRGFEVEVRDPLGQRRYMTVGAGSSPALELLLLNSSPQPLEGAVRQTVMDSIRRTNTPIEPVSLELGYFNDLDDAPVCVLPTFDPMLWNRHPTVRLNNCYNYATQRQTNTFAQPGRATGLKYTKPVDASDVIFATIRDGFMPVPYFHWGTCVIALTVWPGVDYHYYRLDNNMLWSHKTGKNYVRNTDNSGQLISDPRTADRGQYVVFAGYFLNHPLAIVD
ncbi:insoluble matrix shell protein 1-like isoform X2 [Dreissena polymorpha]|nr:insoluble matrix shell protein 1-like isoform X2 [Dreissena polymorpha]